MENPVQVSAELMAEHDQLVKKLDDWSRWIQARYADQMECGLGCARCCHGLFDVSVFDARRLVEGLDTLPVQTRRSAEKRAVVIHRAILGQQPDLKPPYLLNSLSTDTIDHIVDMVGEVRCPFLDTGDACLIYEYRPLTCRLEGIPMVDASDGLFSDWCELNFRHGISSEMRRAMTLEYYGIQAVERDTSLFIPSIIYAVTNNQWTV